jgi:chromosome segregation ATPase
MPYLAFNLNDVNEFVFDILEERLSIGRDAKNDIVIDNTCISGSHAEFLRKPDGVYELVDLKSANGTFVNGRRIQRSLVKGGDKIRFGQLDARFREQAPKGTAPASGSKPSSQPKASPAHSDGRRGDTEPKRDTSPIEPARSFQTLREGAAAAAPSAGSLSIAIPSSATLDLALLKQREKLAAEVRRLRQERDLLRSETENQIRLREEVRAMESSLDERRKEAQAADARLAETRAATMEYANRYSIINSAADARLAETRAAIATAQAEAEKLASKKRDVADLDSQIESKRTQLSKVQADIETANTAFQSLHTDADKARNDRLEAEKQLADLHTQIQQHEAKSSELEAIFNTAQKQKQSDLATLEAKLQANQAEKEQLDKTLAELSQPNQQLQAQATDLTNKQDDLAGTDVKLGEANTALKAVESNEAELTAAISQMVVKRDSLAREILSSTEKSRAQNTLLQTLTVRRGAVDAEVRSSEEQQASLSAEISKARESLRATETTLETRKQELATAESRAAQFTQQAEESVRQQTQIQQEIAQVRGELVKEQAELQQIRTDTQNAMTAAEEAEAAHARHSSQAVAMQTQISGLETLLATLLTSQTDRQTNLVALEAEQRRCEDGLNLRELEVSKADARLAELKAQTANYESRLSELASMEKNLAETKAAWIAAGQEQESLKIEAERLQRERADHEKRLLDLQTELVNAQSELKTQLIELETSQASAKEVAERVSALEDLETQLIQAEKRLEEVRRDITLQMTERDGVSALVLTLFSQRAEHENLLPKLRADVQVLKTELQTLTQDKNSIMVALERVQADRHAALEQTESLLAESANLQERLTEKRDTLEAEIKARLAETNQAEARLIEITAKVAASEKRVSDLAVAQEQLTECQNALKETEVRRHAEEKALAELVKQQDRLRNELFTLEDGIRAGTGAVNDLTTKIKS